MLTLISRADSVLTLPPGTSLSQVGAVFHTFQVLDLAGQPQRGDAAVQGAVNDLEFQAGQVLAQALVRAEDPAHAPDPMHSVVSTASCQRGAAAEPPVTTAPAASSAHGPACPSSAGSPLRQRPVGGAADGTGERTVLLGAPSGPVVHPDSGARRARRRRTGWGTCRDRGDQVREDVRIPVGRQGGGEHGLAG